VEEVEEKNNLYSTTPKTINILITNRPNRS
jgi:hypothetical protein